MVNVKTSVMGMTTTTITANTDSKIRATRIMYDKGHTRGGGVVFVFF